MVKLIQNSAELAQVLATKPQVMLKFSATWCGPCKAVAPVIAKMEPQFPRVYMAEVDIDENQDIAQKYEVTAVPSFVFLNGGNEVNRVLGANVQGVLKSLQAES